MTFLLFAEITIKLMGKILHRNYFRKFFQCYKGPGYPEDTYAAEFITDDYGDNFINERCSVRSSVMSVQKEVIPILL